MQRLTAAAASVSNAVCRTVQDVDDANVSMDWARVALDAQIGHLAME